MFLIAFLIQTSLLNLVMIHGYTPHLILCLVIVLSFLYENRMYGVVFGAAFGVLYDICFSNFTGPTGISLVVVAIVILILREYANIENILNMWIASTISISPLYFFSSPAAIACADMMCPYPDSIYVTSTLGFLFSSILYAKIAPVNEIFR